MKNYNCKALVRLKIIEGEGKGFVMTILVVKRGTEDGIKSVPK